MTLRYIGGFHLCKLKCEGQLRLSTYMLCLQSLLLLTRLMSGEPIWLCDWLRGTLPGPGVNYDGCWPTSCSGSYSTMVLCTVS